MAGRNATGGHNVLLINDLKLVEHVFIKDADCFVDPRQKAREDEITKNMILFAKGDAWMKIRHSESTTFTGDTLQRMSRESIQQKIIAFGLERFP